MYTTLPEIFCMCRIIESIVGFGGFYFQMEIGVQLDAS